MFFNCHKLRAKQLTMRLYKLKIGSVFKNVFKFTKLYNLISLNFNLVLNLERFFTIDGR